MKSKEVKNQNQQVQLEYEGLKAPTTYIHNRPVRESNTPKLVISKKNKISPLFSYVNTGRYAQAIEIVRKAELELFDLGFNGSDELTILEPLIALKLKIIPELEIKKFEEVRVNGAV